MRKQLVITLAALVAFAAVNGLAAGFGLKPGLWESRIVKHIMDGRV